jgi:hypothetical protein
LPKPPPNRTQQLKPPQLDQFCCLPTGDGAYADNVSSLASMTFACV